ncbi:MAG TPA: lysophospholipid acyltransferase family protein [Chitinophagaceae bacterium]|nr:lysophospholipid acyltransferase family protein [Chitinophagaceae bacterium]
MKLLLKPFRIIYCIYAFLVFVALMLVIFPFVLTASFFGRIRGGNAIYRLCMLWGDCWFPLVGIMHKNIHETQESRDKQFIYVANHISYLDAPVIVKTLRTPIRPLGKAEMSKIPVFGYIYKNAVVQVDRSNAEARAKSVRQMKAVLRRNISIFIFPEGTFNTTGKPLKEFYDGAFRIAIETQTPIRPVLFLNAYDRMHYRSIFTLNPGRSRSVFLEPVPVQGLTMRDVPALKQQVSELMERKLIEYGASWIKAPVVMKSVSQ